MYYAKAQKPELLERGIAGACYLSGGLIGLIYILFSGKYSNTTFFRFHFLQAIVLSIFIYLLGWTGTIIKDILGGIFGLIFSLLGPLASFALALNIGIDWLLFLINKATFCLLIYGCLFALLGKYAEIPGLSKLIYRQMR